MGTTFSITVHSKTPTRDTILIRSSFRVVDSLEASMSDYRNDSEINRLRSKSGWQRVSPDLWEVLRFSRDLARQSSGAFDPTIGALSKLWRRVFATREFPEAERVVMAKSHVRWRKLRLQSGNRVKLKDPDLRLDLGGVAKGYATDKIAGMLRKAGRDTFLIDGGGDLLLGAPPPGQTGWLVRMAGGDSLRLANVAVATSGATYKYLEHEGRRYSHIIDPRTGYGVTGHRIVTIVGPEGMVADALASAGSVMSEEQARKLIKKYPQYNFILQSARPRSQ